jgi:hypothetical protein
MAVAIICSTLILLHTYMASQLPGSLVVRTIYNIPAGPPRKDSISSVFDLLIPLAIMSFVIGWSFHSERSFTRGFVSVIVSIIWVAGLFVWLHGFYRRADLYPSQHPLVKGNPSNFQLSNWVCSSFFYGLMSTIAWFAPLPNNNSPTSAS